MNNITMACRGVLATALAVSACFASDSRSQVSGSDLLARAASKEGIRRPGSKPFFLRMQIHAEGIVAKPMDGIYQELWIAPDKWRRELAFAGFQQLEIGDAGSKWVRRDLDYRPRVASVISIAIEDFENPAVLPQEKITSLRHRKSKQGEELQCVQLDAKGNNSRVFCLDSSGIVVSEERENQLFEYGSYGKAGDRVFPKSIRVLENGKKLLDARADDLSDPPPFGPDQFQHDSAARQVAACERSPEVTKKVAPHYPEDARAAQQEGTVILYARLSAEGRVEQTNILQSAGASLDGAAAQAVKQWTYQPVVCGTTPLPAEIEITLHFDLD